MCGISVIINPTAEAGTELELMLKKIQHRGDTRPVQKRLGNAWLGSVRLQIVDQPHGAQPFFNETKTVGVVFNGEIYNFKELKSALTTKGHVFTSECDTEVLVHLYEEYGLDFICLLDGMFSFLIYDAGTDSFLGARDFFGVKPFFYCRNGDTLYISSEMKSFEFLPVEEFEELKPGHCITERGVFSYYKTSNPTWNRYSPYTIAFRIRELVEAAVFKRVQTDLPIATFLSGGLDSSIIHLLCCKFHKNVTALIIGDDQGEDVMYAKRLCIDLKLKYHHIRITSESLLQDIPALVYAMETFEPNVIRGSLLSMKLAEVAHGMGFKVVLCGEGSDEIFGGYGDFLFLQEEDRFQATIDRLFHDLYRTQLLRIDKTAMRYAVEVREPFLDRALVEYALNIHPSLKVSSNDAGMMTTKFILRKAFQDILPDYIYRREKMTLMKGAGIGGVEKRDGILYQHACRNFSDDKLEALARNFPDYGLKDKEEAYCFEFFRKHFLKALFAKQRVVNAQKEIFATDEHRIDRHLKVL